MPLSVLFYRITGGFMYVCVFRVKIAALGSLKRVTESIFKISFKEAS